MAREMYFVGEDIWQHSTCIDLLVDGSMHKGKRAGRCILRRSRETNTATTKIKHHSLTAEEPLLLDESPGHPEGVLVVGLDPLVHYGPVDAEQTVKDCMLLFLFVEQLELQLCPLTFHTELLLWMGEAIGPIRGK